MNYYLIIFSFLLLSIWGSWQYLDITSATLRDRHHHHSPRRSTISRWGIIAASTTFLTIGLNYFISPLVSLGLAIMVSCAIGMINSGSSSKSLLPTRFQQWLWSLVSLVSVLVALLLWLLPTLPDLVKVSCTAIVFCYGLAVLMRRWIKLRAWVMTGIILSTLLGSIHLEGFFPAPVLAATETIPAGAYIIDMGQATQDVAKGLKPYGLVYELVVKKAIPVKWAIDPNKAREGADFTAGGKTYKGGSFIISAEYVPDATSANAAFAAWKAQGVMVDGPLASSFTAPVYATITNFPNAVLDFQNGSIAQSYFTNAGIPASTTGAFGSFNTYRFGYPSSLTPCDDVFVMPHADPTWATHQNLIPFVQSRGFIWAACHAVSVLEKVDDPGDADLDPDMNFLSHIPPAIQDSKSLKLFGKHASPTAGPYQYANSTATSLPYGYGGFNLWAYPIMQFLGKIDTATQNGSEQIYIPDVGAQWRNETAIAVYDDNNTDAVVVPTRGNPSSQIKAAKMAFGPAFGNPNNGLVMYEAGHSHAKGTLPDNIAAQRAFLNFVLLNGLVRGISVNINIPTNITASTTVNLATSNNGGPAVVATGGNGSFAYRWYSSCGGTFSNATAANPTFTAPATAGACTLRVVVTDSCNRRSFGSDTTIIDPVPAPATPVDLEVFKTDNLTTLLAGNSANYTVTVKNNGPNTLSSFTLADVATVTSGGSAFTAAPTITVDKGTYNNSTGLWSRTAALAVGEVLTFTVSATVNSAATGSLTNTATVSLPTGFTDPNPSNNSSADTDTLQARTVDISVTKNDGITTVYENQSTTYTITVTNNGNVTIPGIQIQDRVYRTNGTVTRPSTGNVNLSTLAASGDDAIYGTIDKGVFDSDELTVSSLSKAGSSFTNSSGTVVTTIDLVDGNNNTPNIYQWRNANLVPGETVTLQLTGTNKAKTNGIYIANVISVQPLDAANTTTGLTDTIQTNNGYYDADLTLDKLADLLDLQVTKTITTPASPTLPSRGNAIAYTIDVVNPDTGKSAAGVAFQDIIPNDITPSNWTCQVLDVGKIENNNKDAVTAINRFTRCNIGSNSSTVLVSGSSVSNTPGNMISGTINPDPLAANRMLNGTLNLYKATNNSTPSKIRLTVTGTVNANATSGTVTNTATISGVNTTNNWQDTNLANNTASASYTLAPLYKMSIAKTDGLTQVGLGQTVPYTITVTNSGSDTATAIKVVDDLAQNYLLSPVYSVSAGTYNGATGDWTGLNLAAGQSVTLTVTGTVANNTPTTGPFINTATLTVPSGVTLQNSSGTVVTSLTATDSDTVNPSADLAITKTDNQTSAIPGNATSYAITVTNNGPSTLTSLTVNDTVPVAILNPVFSASTGTYAAATGAWTGLNLAAGQSITLSLDGMISPTATGTLSNTATVAPPVGVIDVNGTNNSATDTTTLSPTADLAITKTDGKATVNPGEAIVYTVRVTNNGPSTVTGATVADTVPAAITGVTWTCTISTGTGSCGTNSGSGNTLNTTVNLNSGATANYTITSTSNTAANPSTITNTATVTAPGTVPDPDPSNNSSTDTTIVPTPSGNADLQVSKQAPAKAFPGGPITYTITVKNNGTDPVSSVTLTETLPPEIAQDDATLFFSSPDGIYNRVTGEWTFFAPLASGQQVTLILDSEVKAAAASGTITNTVRVAPPAGFTDSIPGNNTAQAQTLIAGPVASAELLMVKRVTAVKDGVTNNVTTFAQVLDNPATTNDNHPNWPSNYLVGAYNAGSIKPGDEIEYTVYFMNANGADAKNVKICDRIVGRQAFVNNGYGTGKDVQFRLGNGSVLDFTRAADSSDRAQLYNTGVSPPTSCNLPALPVGTKDNGTLAIDITGTGSAVQPNLMAIPGATGPGTPTSSYGFFRFKTKVNSATNP